MFGKGIRLFRLFGFSVEIDASWLIIAALVTWSLAGGYFPAFYEDLPVATYWWMGAAGAVGLFISIVVHEFSHSLVARRYGLQMRGIRLFIFGGVAQMDEEPDSAKTEFMMAVAGPIASVLISAGAFGLHVLGSRLGWGTPVGAVLLLVPGGKWQTNSRKPNSSANSCKDTFHSRERWLLPPPPSAVISSSLARAKRSWPISFHHRRMLLTANWAVSWSIPTLTQPWLCSISYTP
jgi:hypothetical protein